MQTKSHMLKKLAYTILTYLLICVSLTTPAFAKSSNTGIIAINDSTGTTPDAYHNVYSAEDSDEMTFAVLLRNIIEPDYLTITFEPGIELQEIAPSHYMKTAISDKVEYTPKDQTWIDEQTLKFDISDLPDNTAILTLNLKCSITEQLAHQISGSRVTAIYNSKNKNIQAEIKSAPVQGLRFCVKTVDTSTPKELYVIDKYQGQYINSGVYRLYRDEHLNTPVYFIQHHAQYSVCQKDNPAATQDLACDIGLVNIMGLHEGTYYLEQIEASDENNLKLENPIEVNLTTKEKYDPDDPANRRKQDEKDAGTLVGAFKKSFENFDKKESYADKERERKEKERQRIAETEYHNAHDPVYVSYLELGDVKNLNVNAENTDDGTDLIIDYNQNTSQLTQKMTIIFAIILLIIFVIIIYMLTSKHHEKSNNETNNKTDNEVHQS